MLKVNYISKNHHSMNETTTYWFEIDGVDYGTEKTFDNETFGVADWNGYLTVFDADGCHVLNDYVVNIVLRECESMIEMIRE